MEHDKVETLTQDARWTNNDFGTRLTIHSLLLYRIPGVASLHKGIIYSLDAICMSSCDQTVTDRPYASEVFTPCLSVPNPQVNNICCFDEQGFSKA